MEVYRNLVTKSAKKVRDRVGCKNNTVVQPIQIVHGEVFYPNKNPPGAFLNQLTKGFQTSNHPDI